MARRFTTLLYPTRAVSVHDLATRAVDRAYSPLASGHVGGTAKFRLGAVAANRNDRAACTERRFVGVVVHGDVIRRRKPARHSDHLRAPAVGHVARERAER